MIDNQNQEPADAPMESERPENAASGEASREAAQGTRPEQEEASEGTRPLQEEAAESTRPGQEEAAGIARDETSEEAPEVADGDSAVSEPPAEPNCEQEEEAAPAEQPANSMAKKQDTGAKARAAAKKKKGTSASKRGTRKSPEKAKGKKKESPRKPAQETMVTLNEVTDDADRLPMKWYVIHTYSGHENKVKENIQKMVKTSAVKNHFGKLIVPTEEVAEMRKGKKTITTRKFFPSYILIEMFMSEESWHLVNSIPGVTSFVGTGTTPQPLSETEVERILGRMDKEKDTIVPEIPFTLGEHIRIKDGPFSDFTGIIDEINTEKGKLRVLVSIFGRETPVELDFLQVETI